MNNQDLVVVKGTSHYKDSIKPIAGSRDKSKSYVFNLKNEPNNIFDHEATLISVGNNKIGYMPKELCSYYKQIMRLGGKVYCLGVITNPVNVTYNIGAKIFVDNKMMRFNSYNSMLLPKDLFEKANLTKESSPRYDEKAYEYRIKLLSHIFYGSYHNHESSFSEVESNIQKKLNYIGCLHNGYENDLN